MQLHVEKTPIEKFKPVEITIKVTIDKRSELLALLEDEQRLGKGSVCSEEGDPLSDVTSGVVSKLIKIVNEID